MIPNFRQNVNFMIAHISRTLAKTSCTKQRYFFEIQLICDVGSHPQSVIIDISIGNSNTAGITY